MSRGKVLGERYKIGEKIGAGAFGNVYYCVDLSSPNLRRAQNNKRHGFSNDCLLGHTNPHAAYYYTASPADALASPRENGGSNEAKDNLFHSVSEIEPAILESLLTTGAVPSEVLYKLYEEKRAKAFKDHLRRQKAAERKNQRLATREALLRNEELEVQGGEVTPTDLTEANNFLDSPNRSAMSKRGAKEVAFETHEAYAPRGLEDMGEVAFDNDVTAECAVGPKKIGKVPVNYDDMRFDDDDEDQEDLTSDPESKLDLLNKTKHLTSTMTFDSSLMGSSITSPQDIPMRPLLVPKVYAVKVLSKTALRATEGMEAAFEREVESMKIVSERQCRHVINIVDVLQSSRNYYLVMDLADKGNLLTVVVKGGGSGLTVPTARKYFKQLLTGLKAIHDAEVAHRDIKPDNLLLDSWHEIKISDFGFAAYSPPGRKLTRCCGTPQYTAPELHDEDPSYDGRKVDMWSVGVTLYLMVFGRLPFVDPNRERLYEKIRSGYYQIPQTARKPPTPALLHLLSVLLDTNPNTRWTVDMVRRHPWVHGVDTLPASLQKSHIQNIKHRYLKMKAGAAAAVAAAQGGFIASDGRRQSLSHQPAEDSLFGAAKAPKKQLAKHVGHGRPSSGDHPNVQRMVRPSHLQGVYLGASYDEMLNRGGVMFSSPLTNGSDGIKSPGSGPLHNSGSDLPTLGQLKSNSKKMLVPSSFNKGGRNHNPLQGAMASGDIGASSYPETTSSNGLGQENDSFVLNADLLALSQFEAENTVDGIFDDDEAAFAGGAGLQYLLRHTGHANEGLGLEVQRRSASCPPRMLPDADTARGQKKQSGDAMMSSETRVASITFSETLLHETPKIDSNTSTNNQMVQLMVQYLENGHIVPDTNGRLRLGIFIPREEYNVLRQIYLQRQQEKDRMLNDGGTSMAAPEQQLQSTSNVSNPRDVSCTTPSNLMYSNRNSSGGISPPGYQRAALTPAMSSPTSRPITGSPAQNTNPNLLLGQGLQRRNTTPSMNSDRETPQNDIGGNNKFGRNTPLTAQQKAAHQQREIEERVQRGVFKRIGIIHVRIAIHFIAVFFILFVAGALRVLFDIDISLWPWPQFVRTLIQKILTPPTRKQLSTTSPALKTGSSSHHHSHSASKGPSPATTVSTAASKTPHGVQALSSIADSGTPPASGNNTLRQRLVSNQTKSSTATPTNIAAKATIGGSATAGSVLLPIPQSTTTNGEASTPQGKSGSLDTDQKDLKAKPTPNGSDHVASAKQLLGGHSPNADHAAASASTHSYLLGLVTMTASAVLPQKLRPFGISPTSTTELHHAIHSTTASARSNNASTVFNNPSGPPHHTPSSHDDLGGSFNGGLKRRMLASRQRAASLNNTNHSSQRGGRSHVEEFVEQQQALMRETSASPPIPPIESSPLLPPQSAIHSSSTFGSPTTRAANGTGPHSPVTVEGATHRTPNLSAATAFYNERPPEAMLSTVYRDGGADTASTTTAFTAAEIAIAPTLEGPSALPPTMHHVGSVTSKFGSSSNSTTNVGKGDSLLFRPTAQSTPNTITSKVSFVTDKLTTMAAMRAHEREQQQLQRVQQPTSPSSNQDTSITTPPVLGTTPSGVVSPNTAVPSTIPEALQQEPVPESTGEAQTIAAEPSDAKARQRLKVGLRRVESVFVGDLEDLDEEEDGNDMGGAKMSNSELAT